jgi:hypothetical protein
MMKNPLAILPLMVAALGGLFGGTKATGYSLRADPHSRGKRWVGHTEGIAKLAGYNKAMLRCQARSKKQEWAVKEAQ